MKFKYLPGLNSLRFFAAFFVVIMHANISLAKLGMHAYNSCAFFNRGEDAVGFFFTLSGFIITYLLITEINTDQDISIKNFYLRRVFRIWPVYLLVVAIGFILLGIIYPAIYHRSYFTFSIPEGLLMYLLFIPNYAAKNYVVGLLNPLWSIGVEEQFYLFWAPLVKLCKKNLLPMILTFLAFSTVFYCMLHFRVFHISRNWEVFLLTQKFYAMATGCLFAYILHHYYEQYDRSFFANKYVQGIVLIIILWHYIIGFYFSDWFVFKIILSFLYGLLILNISVVKKKIINLEKPVLVYLGSISYGIYMYHMVVDYFLREGIKKLQLMNVSVYILIPLYYMLLLGGAIGIAALSYKYFEKKFLALKDKLHS